ncbi:MAG TPA: hypothetical protein EYP22_06790 [Methanosarcinales archaeon]|nr:hypothetical protein [Methanosarcinales archaeon]
MQSNKEPDYEKLRELFRALSKKNSLEILHKIISKPMRHADICNELGLPKSNVATILNNYLLKNKLVLKTRQSLLISDNIQFFVGSPLAEKIFELESEIKKCEEFFGNELLDLNSVIKYLLLYLTPFDIEYIKKCKSRIKVEENMIELEIEIDKAYCTPTKSEKCDSQIEPVIRKFGDVKSEDDIKLNRADNSCKITIKLTPAWNIKWRIPK